ncbi:MAG: hypothetical protein JNK15_06545 [Planctomycetes bacterium]|nr:hypothetical protein [Planctomycetota bacterium]
MPSLLSLGWSWLRAPANELAFALRAAVRPSGRRLPLPHEDKAHCFAHLSPAAAEAAAATARALTERFALQPLAAASTRAAFAGNLQHLAGLEALARGHAMPLGPDGVVRATDAGCGDFHYATALQRWLAWHETTAPRAVALRGIELDGWVPHRDGSRRGGRARAHAALAMQGSTMATVAFQAADFTGVRLPPQDVVTMFFPFLTAGPCVRWGAPWSRLRPRRFVHRAVASVRPGGWLVAVDQTDAEFARLQGLLAGQPVQLLATQSWACDLVPWYPATADQVGSLWLRLPD